MATQNTTAARILNVQLRRTDLGKKGIRFEIIAPDGTIADSRVSKSFDFHGAIIHTGTNADGSSWFGRPNYFGREDLLMKGVSNDLKSGDSTILVARVTTPAQEPVAPQAPVVQAEPVIEPAQEVVVDQPQADRFQATATLPSGFVRTLGAFATEAEAAAAIQADREHIVAMEIELREKRAADAFLDDRRIGVLIDATNNAPKFYGIIDATTGELVGPGVAQARQWIARINAATDDTFWNILNDFSGAFRHANDAAVRAFLMLTGQRDNGFREAIVARAERPVRDMLNEAVIRNRQPAVVAQAKPAQAPELTEKDFTPAIAVVVYRLRVALGRDFIQTSVNWTPAQRSIVDSLVASGLAFVSNGTIQASAIAVAAAFNAVPTAVISVRHWAKGNRFPIVQHSKKSVCLMIGDTKTDFAWGEVESLGRADLLTNLDGDGFGLGPDWSSPDAPQAPQGGDQPTEGPSAPAAPSDAQEAPQGAQAASPFVTVDILGAFGPRVTGEFKSRRAAEKVRDNHFPQDVVLTREEFNAIPFVYDLETTEATSANWDAWVDANWAPNPEPGKLYRVRKPAQEAPQAPALDAPQDGADWFELTVDQDRIPEEHVARVLDAWGPIRNRAVGSIASLIAWVRAQDLSPSWFTVFQYEHAPDGPTPIDTDGHIVGCCSLDEAVEGAYSSLRF